MFPSLNIPIWIGAEVIGGSSAPAFPTIASETWRVDAADVSGNDGDAIASVTGTYGNIFAQADADKKPLLKTGANGINNNNVLRGDGSNDILVASNFLSGTKGYVYAVVRAIDAATDFQVLLGSGDEASTTRFNAFRPLYQDVSKFIGIGQRNNDVADNVLGTTGLSYGTAYFIIWKSDGTVWSMRVNGADETLNIVAGANNGDWFGDTDARDNVTLFGLKLSSEIQNCHVDCALIGGGDNTDLSAEEQTALETYIQARFGINFP